MDITGLGDSAPSTAVDPCCTCASDGVGGALPECMAPAPAVTYPALALQLLAAHSMAAVPTGVNLETAILVHERMSERIADLIGCSCPSE